MEREIAVIKAQIEALNLSIKVMNDTYSRGNFSSIIQKHIDRLEKELARVLNSSNGEV